MGAAGAGAWILVFIPAARELSSAIFLVGPNTRVISVMLFDLSEEGSFEVLAALGMILRFATLIIAAIGFKAIRLTFEVDSDAPQDKIDQLLKLTERYCVVFQTLANSPKLELVQP